MTMSVITIVVKPHKNDVQSLAYDENGVAIYGLNGQGKKYHLGQISSSFGWAKSDMQNHFKKEFDELYPSGWLLKFDY